MPGVCVVSMAWIELPQGWSNRRAKGQGNPNPRRRIGCRWSSSNARACRRHGVELQADLAPEGILLANGSCLFFRFCVHVIRASGKVCLFSNNVCVCVCLVVQIVDAVLSLDEDLDITMVGVKKVPGGSVTDSFLVNGVAFKKTFSYAGFEQQPKSFTNPKILLLNVELELKSEKENAEVRIDDPDQYQSIVDAEWNIIYEKLDLCVKSGAQIILSKLPVGDLATQYFADRGLFCAGRVAQDDMERTLRATGGVVQTSVQDMTASVLGTCGRFEERQVGNERFNLFMDCSQSKSATIVLRGGAEQFIEEAHRSVHDALMVVKRTVANASVVAGGGAIEMEVSRHLRQYARTIEGKSQLLVNAYAKAFEIIPRQIADNAGHDSTDILNRLRQKHFKDPEEGKWFGVDINSGGICDTYESHVWEPAANKINSIAAATEAACLILSVDETVRNPKSEQPQGGPGGPGGAPMSAAMGGQGMRGMGMGGRGGGLGRGVRAFRGKGGA